MSFIVVDRCSFPIEWHRVSLKRKVICFKVKIRQHLNCWITFFCLCWKMSVQTSIIRRRLGIRAAFQVLTSREDQQAAEYRTHPQTHPQIWLPFSLSSLALLLSPQQAAGVCRGGAKGDDPGQNEKLLQSGHQHGQIPASAHTQTHTHTGFTISEKRDVWVILLACFIIRGEFSLVLDGEEDEHGWDVLGKAGFNELFIKQSKNVCADVKRPVLPKQMGHCWTSVFMKSNKTLYVCILLANVPYLNLLW